MTQLVESGAAEGHLLQDINLTAETLDQLHRTFADRSPTDRLRMYRALGQIASGVLELSELESDMQPMVDLETNQETAHLFDTELEDLLSEADENPQDVTVLPHPDPVQVEAVPFADSAEVAAESQSPVPEQSREQYIKAYFSNMHLSNREAQLLLRLCEKSGQPTRASDLYTGLAGTSSGLKQATSKFIRTLRESEYGQYLTVTGAKGGTRYIWQGHGFALPVSDETSPALERETILVDEPWPEDIADGAVEAPIVDTAKALARYGITLHEENDTFLTVEGIPLRLSAVAVAVVKVIAESGGKTTFRELVQHEQLKSLADKNIARELNEALLNIATALQTHEIAWRDVQTHIDGVKKRTLEMGNTTPTPHLLGQRALSLA